MTQAIIPKDLKDELSAIRKDLNYIKQHMVDADTIMTEDDYSALLEYRKDKKANNLTSHDQLKEELGV